MHPLLERQLRRIGLSADTPPDCAAWQRLLERVENSYRQADQARDLVERSMVLSSREMRELYEQLHRANAELERRILERTADLARTNVELRGEIEARKRSELALRQSEARFRALTELSADWYWEQDEHFRFTGLSESVQERAGLTVETYLGRTRWDLPAVDLSGEQWSAHRALLEAHRPFRDLEFRRVNASGRTVWISVSGDPVFDEAGRFRGYRGIGRNITERKAFEAALLDFNRTLERRVSERTAELESAGRALRRSEARLRGVIDMAPMLILCKDRDGRYLMCNRACAEVYGRTPEGMLGLTSREAGLDAPNCARLEEADQRVRATGKVHVLSDFRLAGADGRLRTFINMRVPFAYSEEHPDAVLGVVTEITELETAQAEVRKLNTELEARVEARTVQLAAAMRELESFCYSISHDLRSPVRAITATAGMALADHGGALPEDVNKLLARIVAAGRTMNAMIDGLLDLSRLNLAEPRRERFDFSALAKEVWLEVAAGEPQRAVDFSLEDGCAAVADRVLARIALQNLLANAFKFTRHVAAPRVEIGSFLRDGERGFYVRDNGAGFDMAYAEKLFGTFQRLHGVNEFEGTGIGLATVQRIVQRHGGRVWAEGKPGQGAVFRFTFGAGA
jgi:PAS domain S-box-containing protein